MNSSALALQEIDAASAEEFTTLRLEGALSPAETVPMVTEAISRVHAAGGRKLLVVSTGLTGWQKPSVSERYFFVQEWARAAQGAVRIAMVARAEMIDPRKFGVTVAANFGLVGEVFTSEDEAVAWLRAQA